MSLDTFKEFTLRCPHFLKLSCSKTSQYENSRFSKFKQNLVYFNASCKIVELITDGRPIGLHQALYPQFVKFSGKLLNVKAFLRKIIKLCFEECQSLSGMYLMLSNVMNRQALTFSKFHLSKIVEC